MSLTFTFTKGSQSLTLARPNFGVIDYSGIEATDYEIEKASNVNYIGEKKRRKKALSRPVSIEFDYLGADSNKASMRQFLIGFFNPFSTGTLTVNYEGTKRQIEYEVSGFQFASRNIYDPLSAQVELTCMDPMFKDTIQSGDKIATWVNGWKWKFTLPFKMKERGATSKNIINSGHVDTPILVEFHGPAVNPKITNLTTGEFIKINQELTSDDTLYISTEFGNKYVEIESSDGVRVNAFDYIDLDSTFFDLAVGDNVIEYATDNNLDPQAVIIYYYNRYLGV